MPAKARQHVKTREDMTKWDTLAVAQRQKNRHQKRSGHKSHRGGIGMNKPWWTQRQQVTDHTEYGLAWQLRKAPFLGTSRWGPFTLPFAGGMPHLFAKPWRGPAVKNVVFLWCVVRGVSRTKKQITQFQRFQFNNFSEQHICHPEASPRVRNSKNCSSWRVWESSDGCAFSPGLSLLPLSSPPRLLQDSPSTPRHSPTTPQHSHSPATPWNNARSPHETALALSAFLFAKGVTMTVSQGSQMLRHQISA